NRSTRGGPRITRPDEEAIVMPCLQRVAVEGHEVVELRDGWEAAPSEPGACADASDLEQLDWSHASVPGTAADVLRGDRAGRWDLAVPALDEQDWWFRRRLEVSALAAGEEVALVFEGLATVAEVYLNGERILDSDSMFTVSVVDIGALVGAENELAICCRALAPLLAVSRRPRARWRTRLVADGGLRFFRTMLIGRAPGFAPGPAVVGPWRPVRLERRRALAVTRLELRPRVADGAGVLAVVARLRPLGAPPPERLLVELGGPGGPWRGELELTDASGPSPGGGGELEGRGEGVVGDVALWWPHTHGEPPLYTVALVAAGGGRELVLDCGRVGFRQLAGGERLEAGGPQLRGDGVGGFGGGAAGAAGIAARRGDEHGADSRDRRVRVGRVPRSVRRARDSRLAGLHVRQPRLSGSGPGVPRSGPARGAPGADGARRSSQPRRAVRLERDCPAGCNARTRSGPRRRPAVRRTAAGARSRSRARCRLRPLGAVGRGPPVPARSRCRQLLRCRRLPACARGRPPAGGG